MCHVGRCAWAAQRMNGTLGSSSMRQYYHATKPILRFCVQMHISVHYVKDTMDLQAAGSSGTTLMQQTVAINQSSARSRGGWPICPLEQRGGSLIPVQSLLRFDRSRHLRSAAGCWLAGPQVFSALASPRQAGYAPPYGGLTSMRGTQAHSNEQAAPNGHRPAAAAATAPPPLRQFHGRRLSALQSGFQSVLTFLLPFRSGKLSTSFASGGAMPRAPLIGGAPSMVANAIDYGAQASNCGWDQLGRPVAI